MTTSIESLHIELLALILEFVDDESPDTTKSAACVNRYFYTTSQLVAHRRKRLDVFDVDMPQTIDDWLTDESVLSGLRHLDVGQRAGPYRTIPIDYSSIARLIGALSNLKTLIWSNQGRISEDILTALEAQHPRAQLKIYKFCRLGDSGEIALSQSTALTAIKAVLSDPVDEAAFRRVIATAPNLKSASLIYMGHPSRIRLGLVDDATFYTHKHPNSKIRNLTLDGYLMNKHILEEWGRFVDMSQVEDLRWTRGVPNINYFQTAPGILLNLKHVSLNLNFNDHPDFAPAVSNYLEKSAPLRSLSLWSWMKIVSLSTILDRHGNTLEMLQLHEREAVHFSQPRSLLSAEDITSIRDACPKLRDFTFDMDREDRDLTFREGGENQEKVQVLSTFGPTLEKVQIYFDLGIMSLAGLYDDDLDSDSYLDDESEAEEENDDSSPAAKRQKRRQALRIYPPSSEESIKACLQFLWHSIYSDKIGRRALDVKCGEWERKVAWPEENRTKSFWQVRPPVRDDGMDAGDVGCIISCIGGPAKWGPKVPAGHVDHYDA